MFAGEGIGVVPVGKCQYANVHVRRKEHVDTPERSFYAGGIAVVKDGDVRREAFN